MEKQRGYVHSLLVLLLIVGIAVTAVMVQQKQIFKPRAATTALISEPVTPTPVCQNQVICNINGDKQTNNKDGALIKSCWDKPATGLCAKVDVDCDGRISTTDIQKFAYQCPQIFKK